MRRSSCSADLKIPKCFLLQQNRNRKQKKLHAAILHLVIQFSVQHIKKCTIHHYGLPLPLAIRTVSVRFAVQWFPNWVGFGTNWWLSGSDRLFLLYIIDCNNATDIHRSKQCTVPDKSLVAWVQIDLKCPSNIFLINIFLQEMAHFNPNSFWNNVLVQNKTVEKYSNVHSLVKPIESIFAKTKVLSPCNMMHPILD